MTDLPLAAISNLTVNLANVAVFSAILAGVALHSRRLLHARIMRLCFVADVIIVLVIELQKSAIMQTVHQVERPGLKPLLSFHIAVSVAALVLWVVQLFVGAALLRGEPRLRRHRIVARAFLALRATNVVTAFFVAS